METTQASFSHFLWENPVGEARKDALKLNFDRRVKVEFHGTEVIVAEAAIDGHTVLVHHSSVAKLRAVRFAWHQEAQPNLVNGAGLPAAPFRSDN